MRIPVSVGLVSCLQKFWHQTQTDERATMLSWIMAAKPDSPPPFHPEATAAAAAGSHLVADAQVPKPLSNRNRGVPRLIDRA